MFGEVTGEGKNNTEKKNLIDLIRLGLFMKDAFDNILPKTGVNRIFAWQVIGSTNKDNEDTFVHNALHNLISEIFRDPMLELIWANSESTASKSWRLGNKENVAVKGNKPDFKISANTKDDFGEVKPRDSSSVLVKKDLVKLRRVPWTS